MVFDEEIDASELATRGDALVDGICGSTRRRIRVNVEEVAHLDIGPSCYGMNEAPMVVIGIHNTIDSSHGMRHSAAGMLSPTFVPNHPSANAWMVTCGFNEFFVFAIEVLHGVFEVAYCSASAT